MEGINIKTFLTLLKEYDSGILNLLRFFRIEEREGKIHLLTKDADIKRNLEARLGSTLKEPILRHIRVSLEGEVEQAKAERKTLKREEHPPQEGLNSKYSFNNFVVGEGNRLAYEVAKEVAENPGTLYNPLFIYGNVGLGKTHLLQAIGNHCAQKGMRVVYRSANDFSEEMVDYLKGGKIKDFRNRYRKVDLLLLDDIQFLSGKTRTQVEFFNVFNHMFMSDRQIVLASDRHPKDLKDVSDRLVSRFEGGIVVEVCLDEITKLEIIKRKLQELRIEVQDRIVESLMESTSDNVRDIEGTIKGIKLKGVEHLKKGRTEQSDLEKVKLYTALHLGVKVEDLLGNKRSKKINRARHIAFYLCRRLTDASLIEIARAFNRNDHSTVIYGIKKIEGERKKDRKLNYILSFLEKHILERL